MNKTLQFKVSSALKSIIGRDLITDDFVAIFELVKNSYDARAKNISVYFEIGQPHSSSIYIADDGKGMSEADMQEKWLFVAYSAKKDGTEDLEKKTYAGNKGVGRFSCDRLGGILQMQTKTKDESKVNVLTVNWGRFENDAKDFFSKIDMDYTQKDEFDVPEELRPHFRGKSGVILKITHLREPESWDRKKLINLRQHLAKLINPFGDKKTDFSLRVLCPSEATGDSKACCDAKEKNETPLLVNGVVENTILKDFKAKTTWLESRIEDNWLHFTLTDRGEMIYKTREKLGESFILLADVGLSSEIFFVNASAKRTFHRMTGRLFHDFGSLFLFKNEFRVYPIGEEGNDYWTLDKRKAQGYSRYLGTRDVMGKVEVHGDEKKFKESSSRDKGLIETPAAIALREYVLLCIRRLERYVVGVSWVDKLDKDYETLERMKIDSNRARIIELVRDLTASKNIELLDYNKNLVGILNQKSVEFESSLDNLEAVASKFKDNELLAHVEKAKRDLKTARKQEAEAVAFAEREREGRKRAELAVEKANAQFDEERKRNLFLTGSSSRDKEQLESFIHQMIIFAGDYRATIDNQIRQTRKFNGPDWDKNNIVLVKLREGIEKIITTARYLTAANFRLDSGKVTTGIASFIFQHLTRVAPLFSNGVGIECNELNKDFHLTFSPIEVGMILDNLISNARKARATNIFFHLALSPDFLEVRVSDNGDGLAPEFMQEPSRVFEKGVTRTHGSGIGLWFCKNVMESLGGDICLEPNSESNAFVLILTFVKQ